MVGSTVGNLRLMSEEWAVRVGDIVGLPALVDPYSLEEFFDPLENVYTVISSCIIVGNHVIVEFDCTDRVLSHEEIGLSVVINKNTRIDKVAIAYYTRAVDADERMSEGIVEGAMRCVTYSYTYVFFVGRVI